MRALAAKHGATIAIVALLVLNVVLIVPLFTGQHTVPPDATSRLSSKTATPSPARVSPSPSPGDTSSPPSDATLMSGRPRRLLTANSEQIAWRAEPAACGQDSKIEVTTDGGKHWRPTDSSLKSVVRLKGFGDSSVFAIGADKNCQPTYAVAAYPGATWQFDDSMLAKAWFRMPNDLNTVHDPQDNTSQPCGKDGLVDLAGRGDHQATVLCADGSLRIRHGGHYWHTAVKKSHAVALNADDNRFVMAEVAAKCDGLAVQEFSLHGEHVKTKKRHCLKGLDSNPGAVAVTNRLGTTLVWSGDAVSAKR